MKKLSTTWRLALSYLAIIMTLSLLFSAIVFVIISSQLDRPLPPGGEHQVNYTQGNQAQLSGEIERAWLAENQARLEQRDSETRGSVLVSLVALNIGMLVGGVVFSYYLARRTLRPIEESIERQTQFVSDASHELRTPLAALLTTNEVALRKKSLSEDKARTVLQRNIDEVGKLRELTNNLLELTQANKQQISRASFDINELVDELVARYQPSANKKQIKIEREILSDKIEANRSALLQILGTLVDNAIKYSPKNQTVTIKFDGTKFMVIDHGDGISTADQTKIFDRFYRSDSARTRTNESGYGLGLAIAKAICDRNGYKLGVISQKGKGSTFEVWID